LAIGLDIVLGDPRSWPHPVKGIAWYASFLEKTLRPQFTHAKVAGYITAIAVYLLTVVVSLALWIVARHIHPLIGCIVAAIMIYFSIAAKDLADHAMRVVQPLRDNDLPAARNAVAQIVGRDTDQLDPEGVAKAATESVAESASDGVIAPLFWALLLGPAGALLYRAINTLDSMFGHKDDQYQDFGYCSAKTDDYANWIPARLCALSLCWTAAIYYGWAQGKRAWRIWRRDCRNHASPNSGHPESAMAGALGVRFGGLRYYSGIPQYSPLIGDADRGITVDTIEESVHLMRWAMLWFIVGGGIILSFAVVAF